MENQTGVIFRIKKYALHDGPGIRTTVFLKGCPLRCRWCHNPEGIAPEPQSMTPTGQANTRDAIIGNHVTAGQVMAEIRKDVIFYDESGGGATFSGGEPLMQPAFLTALLDLCRAEAIHTTVDTSGFASPETMAAVAPKTDLILFDLKLMDETAHRHHTGVSNDRILKNLAIVTASGTPVRIRIPLIPGITDSRENLEGIADRIRSVGAVNHVDLLPFHPAADAKYQRLGMANPMAGIEAPAADVVDDVKAIFRARGFDVKIGG
ncbi:MAG: glycyl-radical enzyme activating protein [Desulfobacterales bacterium]|nr:glycyl-radical enzyme activating protein [Desulfobacterales bacterium]